MPTNREEKTVPANYQQEPSQKIISESSLYPLWESSRNRSFPTASGENLIILSPGIRNFGKGPDYRNCFFLKKGRKTIFSCDVEIHVKVSDWKNHQHHLDPHFGKVLLHVFLVLDTDLTKLHYHNIFHVPFPNYLQKEEPLNLPVSTNCEGNGNFHSPEKRAALAEIGYSKLYEKGLRIHRRCNEKEKSLWATILRVHGQTKNSEIFLDTGMDTLDTILKKRDKLSAEDIHIVLTGASRLLHALLEKKSSAMTPRKMLIYYLKRWTELQAEHNFSEIPYAPWDFHGIRPFHHPFMRFLQFSLLLKSLDISAFMNDLNIHGLKQKKIEPFLKLNDDFLSTSQTNSIEFGSSIVYTRQMIELIMIDGIIPWLLVQNARSQKRLLKETLFKVPYRLSKNSKTRFFTRGIPHCFREFTFLEAQGLIRIHDEFCSFRNLSCAGCAFHPAQGSGSENTFRIPCNK